MDMAQAPGMAGTPPKLAVQADGDVAQQSGSINGRETGREEQAVRQPDSGCRA
jgi:hypothetical protein